MPELFSPVDYAIPAFIILIIAEMLWARSRAPEKYEPRDTLTSLALGTGSTVAGALTGALVFSLAMWMYENRLFDIGWVWWAWRWAPGWVAAWWRGSAPRLPCRP